MRGSGSRWALARPAQRRHAGAGANFVDVIDGASIIRLLPVDRGSGHPPQQFIYQPAVDRVLRRVDRFGNVSVLLEHEYLRLVQHPTASS